MLITTLVDNTVSKPDLLAEHGLSLMLETEDEKILFDAGQKGHTIIHNADTLGVDLSDIDKIVLSHGHSDHTGGLDGVLTASRHAKIYGHPDLFDEKYSKTQCEQRLIGIPYTREALELRGAKLNLSRESLQITDTIQTTGEIRRRTNFEMIPDRLCTMRNGQIVKDALMDDLSLIVTGEKGLAVIFGCSHSGIINTLLQVREMMSDIPINVLVGGIHLVDATEERIEKTIEYLKELNIEKMALCHCTGRLALIRLYEVFGDILIPNHVGSRIEWE